MEKAFSLQVVEEEWLYLQHCNWLLVWKSITAMIIQTWITNGSNTLSILAWVCRTKSSQSRWVKPGGCGCDRNQGWDQVCNGNQALHIKKLLALLAHVNQIIEGEKESHSGLFKAEAKSGPISTKIILINCCCWRHISSRNLRFDSWFDRTSSRWMQRSKSRRHLGHLDSSQ